MARIAWLFWLCAVLTLAAPDARAGAPAWLAPPSAQLLLSNAEEPPPEAADWQAVTLPDNWRVRDFMPHRPGAAWYRIALQVPAEAVARGGWAVYLPYLHDGGSLYFNGERMGYIPEPDAETHVKWERPHLLSIPQHLLRAGANVLTLRTAPAQAIAGDLAVPALLVGPAERLQPLHDRRLFWVNTVPLLTTGICLVAAALMLFIWWRRRSEALYGLFGLTALLWGVRTLTFVVEVLPQAQWPWWRGLYLAATGGFVVALALFALRFANLRWPKLERALVGYGLLGPLLMLLSRGSADGWVNRWWLAGFLMVGVGIIAAVTLGVWRQRTYAAFALMASVWITVLGAAHDYMVLISAPWLVALAPDWAGARLYVFHTAANAVLVVMGGILAGRFVNTLRELEALNQTLEDRVAEREALLRGNYVQLSALERERAAVAERQRIMQDMHDGLGSQLFTSLSRTERQELTQDEMSETLRGCIAEMRLAIEALAPGDGDLQSALGDFRFRWEAQLQAAGLTSSWRLDLPDEEATPLSPHATLQVLRILQEALTNVLKHARAHHVRVWLQLDDGRLRAEVCDDGLGLPVADASGGGRGLRNMRTRAARLGAELRIEPAPAGGTRVALHWALSA